MKTLMSSLFIGLGLIAMPGVQAAAQNEKPQPIDSARAQQNPEERTEAPRQAIDPLAEDKRSDTSTKSFDQLDANKDGKLGKDELGPDEAQGMDFSKIDRDADGSISRDEWNAYWSGRHDKH